MKVSLKVNDTLILHTEFCVTEDPVTGYYIITRHRFGTFEVVGKCLTLDKAEKVCYLLSEIEIEEITNG